MYTNINKGKKSIENYITAMLLHNTSEKILCIDDLF